MNIDQFNHVFHDDGSLRYIYIFNTNIRDWELFYKYIKKYELKYERDGDSLELPKNVESIFQDNTSTHLLSIKANGILINVHFYLIKKIEMDLDPREIKNINQGTMIEHFIIAIGSTLKKAVCLTEKNTIKNELTKNNLMEYNNNKNKLIYNK